MADGKLQVVPADEADDDENVDCRENEEYSIADEELFGHLNFLPSVPTHLTSLQNKIKNDR